MCCQAFLVSQKSSHGPQEPPGRGLPQERGPQGQILFSQTSFESKLTCRVLLLGAHWRKHAGWAGREGANAGRSTSSILAAGAEGALGGNGGQAEGVCHVCDGPKRA